MDLSDGSCSRTRSGLVRRKRFMGSSDDSCSRTRSGLVRRKSFIDSGGSSCSKTRSGLVRRKSFMDSGDGSCSWTRNGLVRESPSVKDLIMDESLRKGLPDADGLLIEETPSRTRSGLVRQRPIVKREDMPVATQSGLVRGNPIKTRREIKGLADGWLKEDKPLGTRSGLVRGSFPVKALSKSESVAKGQHDGWLKDDKPGETQSDIIRGSHSTKTLRNDESVTEGLPDGWWKEYRPRKPGSSQKNDPYFIDPVSGFEFRSLKDVHRYIQTGDIGQCAIRPKKGTLYDVCVTENQTHASSSLQQTRPNTADKGIQCEILTSEGIMLPWEQHFTPQRENNTEDTMSPESESMKTMEGNDNKIETLQQNGVLSFMAHRAPRQTESIKRKDQNVKVKSKRHKSEASPTVTPLRVSPRLAALNAQSEASIEPEDQPISINHINQLQSVEDNNNCLSDTNQSSTMAKIHGNEERIYELWSNQEHTVNRMQVMQESTSNHSQPSQVDTLNHIQMNLESSGHQLQLSLADTDIQMLTVNEYTTDQPSQADSGNHKQINMENAVNQFQSSLADTVDHIEMNQENTAHEILSSPEDAVISIRTDQDQDQPSQAGVMNHIKSSIEDTIAPICLTPEFTSTHSQPSRADTMHQIQANQIYVADELQLGEADTVTQIQMLQDNMTNQSQLSQANSLNEIHTNLQNNNNHLETNYAENSLLRAGFSWDAEQNGGALVTDFWKNVESHDSSIAMQIDGVPVASFPASVKFQSATASAPAEPVIPTAQATVPVTVPDQSGLVVPSLFGNTWSDPCIEFAFKTLTGDIPVLDDTAAVTDYFPQQPDLNKGTSTTPNCSAPALDNSMTHEQVDVNLPLPTQVDVNLPLPTQVDVNLPLPTQVDVNLPWPKPYKLYNGSWFPTQ